MILGYNTNGFAHHRLHDAFEIIAELGYRGVALTPDFNHLDPDTIDSEVLANLISELGRLSLSCVIETGSRYLLDPRRKHYPTLLEADEKTRAKRRTFLESCILLSKDMGSPIVSFWSGAARTDESHPVLFARLADECRRLADFAAKHNVRLAFEPEPGMLIDTMDKFAELYAKVDHSHFGLTLDIGHLICMHELPISKTIHTWKHALWNVHIDDMKRGVHDHLMFGEGEVDFHEAFAALNAIPFEGMVSVELSRHSFDAVNVATKSMHFLRPYID